MYDIQMGDVTYQFMEMIWANAPIGSGKLVNMAEERFGWKKPTSYTVIRRLIAKGLIKNENCIVTALISKDGFLAEQSDRFVEENFGGSLPLFLAAFSRNHKFSEEELSCLRELLSEKKDR